MDKKKYGNTSRTTAKVAFVIVAIIFAVSIYSLGFGKSGPDEADDADLSPVASSEESGVPVSTIPETTQPAPVNPAEEPAVTHTIDVDDTQKEPPVQPEQREVSVTDISGIDEELSGKLDAVASFFNCVAVSLAVFDGQYDYYTYQYGSADVNARRPVDADTKFRIASLSKLTSAIIAMTLADAGLLDIDEDISTYLGYEIRNQNYPDTAITSRMLMQHTSSVYDSDLYIRERSSYSAESTRLILSSSHAYRNRQPGELFEYSDFGLIVLGAVCENVSGLFFDALANEVLFKPLGIDAAYVPKNLQNTANIAAIYDANNRMTRSVQAQLSLGGGGETGQEHNTAQGSLMISALDYARILAMLANGGVLDGVRILSEEAVREMHNTNVEGEHYKQGLVVRFEDNAFMGDGVYWHTGSAYGTFAQFIYCTESGRGVVAVTTGAKTERRPNGMVIVCAELMELVWWR